MKVFSRCLTFNGWMKDLHKISSFSFCFVPFLVVWRTPSPPQLTAKTPENACLEDDPFLSLLGIAYFQELLLFVLGRVSSKKSSRNQFEMEE